MANYMTVSDDGPTQEQENGKEQEQEAQQQPGGYRRWEKLTKEQMDANAIDAQNELYVMEGMDESTMKKLSSWWSKWYLKAGHKRLGRILTKGI